MLKSLSSSILFAVIFISVSGLGREWDFSDYIPPGPDCLNCCFSNNDDIRKFCKDGALENHLERFIDQTPGSWLDYTSQNAAASALLCDCKSQSSSHLRAGSLDKAILILTSYADHNGGLKTQLFLAPLFAKHLVFKSRIRDIADIQEAIRAVVEDYGIEIDVVIIEAHGNPVTMTLGNEDLNFLNYDHLTMVLHMLSADARIILHSCNAAASVNQNRDLLADNLASHLALAAGGRRVYGSPVLFIRVYSELHPESLVPSYHHGSENFRCYQAPNGNLVDCGINK